jgi:AMMECR1 domain-containing protein
MLNLSVGLIIMVLIHHELSDLQQQILLDVAERATRSGLAKLEYCDPHADWYSCELQHIQACFATLHSGGHLLGSVGTAEPQHPLVIDAARNAYEVGSLVANHQLVVSDLIELQLELAVLGPLHFISEPTFDDIASQIQAGSAGVFVRCLDRAAAFLPIMWENFSDPNEFLSQLCARADIDTEEWPTGTQVATFTTQLFSRAFDKLPRHVPR